MNASNLACQEAVLDFASAAMQPQLLFSPQKPPLPSHHQQGGDLMSSARLPA